ncbi:MAG: FHA domain-containing protein [Prochloraceae cyanobacterium]|nr:FHA domain-containing protein [Prochloraceae cyanobacterium]
MSSLQQQFEHILAIEDEKNQRMITLKEDMYTLGRSGKTSILIVDRQVSRHHATIIRKRDIRINKSSFWIMDGNLNGQKSTNGLIINGKSCVSHKLKIGDIILLGSKTKIKYYKFSLVALKQILKAGQTLNQSILERMLLRQEDSKQTMVI